MKRKVVYDYKLFTSIAYVTQNWDSVCKEKYIKYCMPFWKKRGIGDRMKSKVNQYSEPITLWLHALDEENLKLTLQFFLINESDTEDKFDEFEVDNGL